MTILEEEVWVGLAGSNKKRFESLGYDIPKIEDKSGKIRIKIGTKILAKVRDLPRSSKEKVTKICDDCGKHIKNQFYYAIIQLREKGDGRDRCYECGQLHGTKNRKKNVKYKKSLECYVKKNNKEHLLEEFSDKNLKKPSQISYGTHDEYLWNCPDCKSEYDMSVQKKTLGNYNCPYCSGYRVNHTNCLWTTYPEVAKLLFNPEDGYKYSAGSNVKVDWKCPDCGNEIKSKQINQITSYGLSCHMCSDGISYAEKFMYNVLFQLGSDFDFQKTFRWSNGKKYDFYIYPDIIIEAHGNQHYQYTGFGRTLEEEQKNDKLKENLVKGNGVKRYIVVNCRLSELDYIKNNIVNSELNSLFDLTNIDWLKCHEYACNSLVKTASELWDKYKSVVKIGNELKLSKSTIRKYLKRSVELGWCDYDPKEEMKRSGSIRGKESRIPIIRFSSQGEYIDEFESVTEAGEILGIGRQNISSCLNGRRKKAGGFRWAYKEDRSKTNTCS